MPKTRNTVVSTLLEDESHKNLIKSVFFKKINEKKEGFCERMTNNDTSRYKSTYFKSYRR